MANKNTFNDNIVLHLFEGDKIIQTQVISAEQIVKHKGKLISFLVERYNPTAFELRMEKDQTSDYPRYYFGQTALCDQTGKPKVICKGKSYPLKRNDYVFDNKTLQCTYGVTRLISVSSYLPSTLLRSLKSAQNQYV